jgi:hypothetical protein
MTESPSPLTMLFSRHTKRKDRARVAELLRRLGWTEFAIDAATTHTGARAVTGYATLSDETNELGRWRNPVEG